MLEEIKSVIQLNQNLLPLISAYWEYTVVDKKMIHKNKNEVISIAHNTSKYVPHTFYKTISTTIDLSYYD